MQRTMFKLVIALAIGGSAVLSGDNRASARRGPDFMNSPGYQRALAESRKQRETRQPAMIESRPVTEPRRAKRKSLQRRAQ